MEFRSQRSFLGLPLVHINICRRENGAFRRGIARGWIAIGDIGLGIVFGAGGIGCGMLSFGGLSIGLLAFGGLAMGGLTLGGLSVGTFAVGGAAIGLWAIGGVALAWFAALGGAAFARECALGGASFAAGLMSPDHFISCVRKTGHEARHFLDANSAALLTAALAIGAVIVLLQRRAGEKL